MIERVLGFDTSCYTSSIALAGAGDVFAEKRKLLQVQAGERGLMQSHGVFQHVRNLPQLMDVLMAEVQDCKITAVCASGQPRDIQDSYMPVFKVGEGFARSIAAALNVPYFETSHQQGHVRAAMVGAGLEPGDFIGLHLSGGTTEIFRAGDDLHIELLGTSSDLNAGQLIDRIGVALGLSFPAGAQMDALALSGISQSRLPTSLKDMDPSFSGAEAQAMRWIQTGEMPSEEIAAEIFSQIMRTVSKMIDRAVKDTGIKNVLLAGGVAASAALRKTLKERLERRGCRAKIHWAQPRLSGDNAVGVALIGYEKWMGAKVI